MTFETGVNDRKLSLESLELFQASTCYSVRPQHDGVACFVRQYVSDFYLLGAPAVHSTFARFAMVGL